jgi:uncharacterized membrane protein
VNSRIPTNYLLILCIVLIFSFPILNFQTIYAQTPVIRAVLFYSPTCPACHLVITEALPPLIEKYPNQLQIIGIDVTQEAGQTLYQSTLTTFQVPDERVGVPTLVVGEQVLVGAKEIPDLLPGIIEQGLINGGIDWPGIPGLDQALVQLGLEQSDQSVDEPSDNIIEPSANVSIPALSVSFIEKFMLDPVANTIAVVVLAGMLWSVLAIGHRFLVGKTHGINWPNWVIPALSILGLFVAVYLSYVEVSHTDAICGPIGNCNSVQQSRYANLFGIIPIGMMGVVGYISILLVWLLGQLGPRSLQKYTTLVLWGMAWFGVLFSIYLTFLEPFIIGASCAWCLTSAIIMTLILWASTGPALQAIQIDEQEEDATDEGLELDESDYDAYAVE